MALTAENTTIIPFHQLNLPDGLTLDFPMTASITIYKGSFVSAATATGLAKVLTAVAADPFIGIALETKTSAATGTTRIKTLMGAIIEYPVTGGTQAQCGNLVYASDENTLTVTAGTNTFVGRIIKLITGTTCLIACAKYPGTSGGGI